MTTARRVSAAALAAALAVVLEPTAVAAAPAARASVADPASRADSARGADPARAADQTAPVRITTAVSPKDVRIGTPFRYTIRVEADAGVEVFVPLISGAIGDFVITDYGQGAAEGAGRDGDAVTAVETWYELLAYESGSRFIPAPVVGYRAAATEVLQVEGPKTLVNVDTLLPPPGEEVELRDIRGPVDAPADIRPLLLGLGLVVAALAIAALLYWLGRRRGRGLEVAARPAHEVALEALTRLRRASLIAAGRHEDYYVRLSAIVREYVEGRFSLRAPEMTTEEFLAVVGRGEALGREYRTALGGFLSEADLVKFARHVPSESDAERAYGAARGFVEATAASDPPDPAGTAAGSGGGQDVQAEPVGREEHHATT